MSIAERVLYCDGLMLVWDKPAGWSCVPSGPGEYLTRHLGELTFGKTTLPQVAHRLDRETTGCLLLGRHAAALRSLGALFAERRVLKLYWAMVRGCWPEELLRLETPVQGQEACTQVRRQLWLPTRGCSWLELAPLTGRMHQLRIHCAEAGFPICGDSRYGGGSGPMLLHARRVEVPLYKKKPPVVVEAPLPESWGGFSPAS